MIGSHPKCPRRCFEKNKQNFKEFHRDGPHETYQYESFLKSSKSFLDRDSGAWQFLEKEILLVFKTLKKGLDELEQNILDQIAGRKLKSAIGSENEMLIEATRKIIKLKIDALYCDEIHMFNEQKDKIAKSNSNLFLINQQKDLLLNLNQNLKSLIETNAKTNKGSNFTLIDDITKKIIDFHEKNKKNERFEFNKSDFQDRKTNTNDQSLYSKRQPQQNSSDENQKTVKGRGRQNQDIRDNNNRGERRRGRGEDRREPRREDRRGEYKRGGDRRREDRRGEDRRQGRREDMIDQKTKYQREERETKNQQKEVEKKEVEARNTNNGEDRRDNRRNRDYLQQNRDEKSYYDHKKTQLQQSEKGDKKKLDQIKGGQTNLNFEARIVKFLKKLKYSNIWIISDESTSIKLVAPTHQYLKEGNKVSITHCFSRQFQGKIEVNMIRDSKIELLSGEANQKQKKDDFRLCPQPRRPKGEFKLTSVGDINPNLQNIIILVLVVNLKQINGGYFCRLADDTGVVNAKLRESIFVRQNASLYIKKINLQVIDGHIVLQADANTVIEKAKSDRKNINLKNDISTRYYEEVDD